MPKLKLTDAAVQRIKPPAKGQVDYWDTLLSPFALRVSYNGTKSWITQPRVLIDGKWKPARITLGRYPVLSLADARELAREAIQQAAEGKDPRRLKHERKRQQEDDSRNTFGAIRDLFIERYCERELKASSAAEYKRVLTGVRFKPWENAPIKDITRRSVADLLDEIVDESPYMANRTLAYLRKMMNWAVGTRHIMEHAPTDRIQTPSKEKSRERVLTDDEIKFIWKACDSIGDIYAYTVKMLILTGQRSGEVSAMHRVELYGLDTENAFWKIPPERTKNGRPHEVPLSPLAIETLRTVPNIGDFVFSYSGKTPICMTSAAKRRLDAKAKEIAKGAGCADCFKHNWRIHDIRRTVVTKLNSLGTPPHIVETIVNHVSGTRSGVAGVYNRAEYTNEKRAALNQWANSVAQLTT